MKNNKTINIVADIISPLAIVSVTIALFFVFQPENPGTLFWANMVYLSFLEIIFFAYFVWIPAHGSSVALKWMCGIYTSLYICISLVWMLLFAFVLNYWCPVKLYFSIIAVLTVIWIFIGVISIKVDSNNESSVTTLANNRRQADLVNSSAEMLLQQFNLMAAAHPELSESSSSVTALCRGLATLSPVVMADTSAAGRVNTICSQLENLLAQPLSDNYAANLKDYADKALITLNSIKKFVRK